MFDLEASEAVHAYETGGPAELRRYLGSLDAHLMLASFDAAQPHSLLQQLAGILAEWSWPDRSARLAVAGRLALHGGREKSVRSTALVDA